MASDNKSQRRYLAGVERALALFDAKNEWADYIAFLSRLLKALQAAPKEAVVPSKTVLAQHLAHCLSPSLPAGVHQKTLEVYECIFGILGRDGLSRDLALYLPGFAHTLTFASLTTRPWFLTLYNDHILKLHPKSLRPALKALILSLLPGIEEENSEDFDKTLGTVNKLRQIFANDHNEGIFWQSFFLASITSPSRRAGALVYLVRYLPKVGSRHDQAQVGGETTGTTTAEDIVTPEPGLLFRCFATGLQDEQPLIQRGFLDLLVTHLPLESAVLQNANSRSDLIILVSAAMSIVLRRDMSLNRRLWAWFLGGDEKGDTESTPLKSPVDAARRQKLPSSTYFDKLGASAVIDALLAMMQRSTTNPSQCARPFRLVVSLMDRSAIGGPIVDELFIRLISNLKQYQTTAPSQEAFDEVFRSASMLFDSMDPRRLTRGLFKMMLEHEWDLFEFIVFNFGLEDPELGRTHLPAVVAYLSDLCAGKTSSTGTDTLTKQHERTVSQIAMILDVVLEFVPTQTISKAHASKPSKSSKNSGTILRETVDFYSSGSEEQRAKLATPDVLLNLTVTTLLAAIDEALAASSDVTLLDHMTSALRKLASVLPIDAHAGGQALVNRICDWFVETSETNTRSFGICRNIVAIVRTLSEGTPSGTLISEPHAAKLVPGLVRHLWRYLRPSMPQFHVESVELIWSLKSVCPRLLMVDSTVIDLLAGLTSNSSDHPSVNFGLLWTHTKASDVSSSTNGTVTGQPDVSPFMRQIALLTLDKSQNDIAWTTWLSTLSSLEVHFRAVLQDAVAGSEGDERTLVALYRLRKLVQIARTSPTLWREVKDKGNLPTSISDLATRTAMLHAENERSALVALEILRAIYSEAGPTVSSELVSALTLQLPKTKAESVFQSSLLDTLHSLMSRQPDGNPPAGLLTTLMDGISAPLVDSNIDKWITLLCNSIPTYSDASFFANLLKLTACFCDRTLDYFGTLKSLYEQDGGNNEAIQPTAKDPEKSITNLLSGLEYILARAHTKVLELNRPTSANPETATPAGATSKTVANQYRLTVVLCMQDAIKVCCQMWFWRPSQASVSVAETKSFSYMSARLRAKTRRMLEHLLEAEPQECLETVMSIWIERTKTSNQPSLVMNLLQTLDGARPKFMLPAIFNALYSRTNPNVLDFAQRSTQSVQATAVELVGFLIEYVTKLEDDLLEEIWNDCVSFMRDVLANPMPHRQLLLRLLEFLAALCAKMENTTFGEQSRMRRELADLITRLFTAIFTIKPVGMDKGSEPISVTASSIKTPGRLEAGNGVDILLLVLPQMTPILNEGDRISTVFQGISTNITGPSLRARLFPSTLDNNALGLCQIMAKGSANNKTWRKDLTEAFNDARLFGSSLAVATSGWLPTLRQLTTVDRNLFPDVVTRFVAPATAGIMFGVGASAARTEADKTTKVNLRRLGLLFLAQERDFFANHISQLMPKVEELLTATPSTSPSSVTRGDIFLLFRAMILCLNQENLVSLWSVLDSEIRKVFDDLKDEDGPNLTPYTRLQAAKLLDLLLLLNPEEFQLHEWLFITDTIDAIYPPADLESVAAADSIQLNGVENIDLQWSQASGLRKPWLATDLSRQPGAAESILQSFFSQLSIRAFEATYSLEAPDIQACRRDVLADLFSEADTPA